MSVGHGGAAAAAGAPHIVVHDLKPREANRMLLLLLVVLMALTVPALVAIVLLVRHALEVW